MTSDGAPGPESRGRHATRVGHALGGMFARPFRTSWSLRTAALELGALTGFAIAQPILDVFGNAPEVFVQSGAGRADVVLFAFAVALVPPLLLLGLEAAVASIAGPVVRLVVHACVLGLVGGLFAIHLLKRTTDLADSTVTPCAIVAGTVVALTYFWFKWLGVWLRFAGVAPVVFAALFLFASPVNALLGSGSSRTTRAVAAEQRTRGPVILLVLDEFPVVSLLDSDAKVDAERFPGFAALAKDSTWYRNASSVATHTVYATPAIFTGRYPTRASAAPNANSYPDNLFRLLGATYRLNVVETVTDLCAVPRCDFTNEENAPAPEFARTARARRDGEPALTSLLDRAFDAYLSMIRSSPTERDVEAEASTDVHDVLIAAPTLPDTMAPGRYLQPSRFADWLGAIDGDTVHPQLSVMHLLAPHSPWIVGGDNIEYIAPAGTENLVGFAGRRWLGSGATITARQRHLLAVRYVDTLITTLREHLRSLGIWDETTLIVTADHGASFNPGGYFRRWEEASSPEVVGVPLFVHAPGIAAGRIDDTPAQTVDVVPTIAGIAQVELPWTVDGLDLRSLPQALRRTHPYRKARDDVARNRLEDLDVSKHLERILALRPGADDPANDPANDPALGETGDGDLDVLRSGPHGELIGESIGDVDVGREVVGAVRRDYPKTDRFAPDDEGRVPALLIGSVDDGKPNVVLVVTLDDRIAATALTYTNGAIEAQFTALLPPMWLLGSEHEIRYFVVEERPQEGTVRLQPLREG